MKDIRQIIIDIINDADEIVLTVGENEYYTDNGSYTLIVDYLLETKALSMYGDDYDFSIQSIVLINDETNEEIEYKTDDEIENLLMEVCSIEDWTDEDDIDKYIEDNL